MANGTHDCSSRFPRLPGLGGHRVLHDAHPPRDPLVSGQRALQVWPPLFRQGRFAWLHNLGLTAAANAPVSHGLLGTRGPASFLWIMESLFNYDPKAPGTPKALAGFRACSGTAGGIMFAICTGLLAIYNLNKPATITKADELAARRKVAAPA